ncbi:MAG: hypothetical protein IT178_15180 [Acidobacteria bacterium]|nr:hypothetical protein [Acidobacteriota bacterium]
MRRATPIVGIIAFFVVLTVAMTWPQAAHLRTHVPPFDDSLLSIWRISWIAHALTTDASLVDANIFHPEARTLAYTDAVLLQGLIATPFIAAGASPVLVYNLLILGSIALSAAAMALLTRRLTGSRAAGLVAGTVFGFATFRIDHYMHLELQATVFLPLALWAFDRALTTRARRDIAFFGACLVLQILCGIYYAVFLATALAVAVPMAWWRLPAEARRPFITRLALVGLACVMVAAPYLGIYMKNRSTVGDRSDRDVQMYSAVPVNYLSSDPHSLIYGVATEPLGRTERRLFPGAVALVLAGIGLRGWTSRKTTIAIVGVVGFVISLGLNTPLYDALRDVVFTYRGLRAPARAAILVLFAVAVFAGYGWATLLRRLGRTALATAVLLGMMCVEYANHPAEWLVLPQRPPALARWLAQQPRSVVVELPLPRADALHTIFDGLYMYSSIFHWQPMLNGYSGFYPASYIELIERLRDFPSDAAIDYLRGRGVDLIVVHGSHLTPDQLGTWSAALSARPDVTAVASFEEHLGSDLVFRLNRTAAGAALGDRRIGGVGDCRAIDKQGIRRFTIAN